ncbi:vWA domain-containing protein [Mangrovicoccus ximenensis]|uniref:vWA domain-containing protein n=1 Tax=Mangrovicoccus ximenensis TaxID=1911570 RepID=UPI001F46AA9A|nr:vWA domain-containing protein [Mangrovicoccus ximenensis]
MRMLYPVLAPLLALILPAALSAQECSRDAMVVFDGSGSMSEMGFNQLSEPRIFEARRALRLVMPRLDGLRRIGLMIYGPGAGATCENIELRFPPIADASGPVIAAVEELQPDGETPLTEAVRRAAVLLTQDGGTGDVVLVTDGKETCGGAPCELAAHLAAEHPGLKVHVIGYKVRGERFLWDKDSSNDYTDAQSAARCLAEQTGGEYISAETVEQLISALQVTLGCPLYGMLGKSG